MSNKRTHIRQSIRQLRNNLSKKQQEKAAAQLKLNFTQQLNSDKTASKKQIAIYFSNDGELDTSLLINELW